MCLCPRLICVGNKILMGCGSNDNGNLNDWWEYDIPSNTWSAKPNLPGLERHHPFYFGIGDYAYVGMGHGTLPGPGTNPNTGVNIYSDFYRYNPANSTWQRLGDFPGEARVAGTQFTYNGKGYVLSGDGDNHGQDNGRGNSDDTRDSDDIGKEDPASEIPVSARLKQQQQQ